MSSRLAGLAWLILVTAILLLLGAGFALIRFYGIR